MNENNNYFGDITDLFLKAKKEENIGVNNLAKNAIREMVLHKIKSAPKVNFWKKWRYQIVGVPASLMALIVIVYAATNLDFSLPKEDFTPEVFDSVLETENRLADEEVEAEVKEPGESDNAFLWVVPEDKTASKELHEPRTLNKIVPQTEETFVVTASPVYTEISAETEKDEKTDVPENDDETLPELVSKQPSDNAAKEPATQPATGGGPAQPTEEPVADEPVADEQAQPISDTADTAAEASLATGALTEAQMLIAPTAYTSLKVQYAGTNNVFEKQIATDNFTTYYYANTRLANKPIFDETMLAKITSSGEPTAVTVYYVSGTKVVVEVAYEDTSKWYLFEKVEGNWTIQKYEKELLQNVVK